MPSGVHHVWLGDEDLGIFDENKFRLTDLYQIAGSSGLNGRDFTAGINSQSPLALQTLVWFLRVKAGRPCDRAAIDFAIADLRMEDEPDPTEASSGNADAGTSDTSPTSAI